MHEVQRGVLKRLSLSPKLRFSEIKPRGVESNRFMYHLKTLLEEGLVKKNTSFYKLTAKGKALADRTTIESFEERIQPKIVTLIACKKEDGSYLLYRRGKQPFLGKIGFPYGKIHLGERVAEAALRELKEKTGMTATLEYSGDVYITVHDEEDLITQMLCHVFSGSAPTGELITNSSIGECFWGIPSKIPLEEHIPGFLQVQKLLKKPGKPFFAEYFLDIHEE